MTLRKFTQSIGEQWRSLRVVILAVVALGVTVSFFLAYLYTAEKLRERHLVAAATATEGLADLTALAMREPLWQFDPAHAESILDSVFVNPDVLLIEVTDHSKIPFASRRHPALASFEQRGLTISSIRSIVRDDIEIGKLRLIVSTAGYLDQMEATRQIYARSGILVVVLSLVVILLVLNWRFIRPINHLVHSSGRLATGDLTEPISSVPSLELGRLASSLESTRKALIDLFAVVNDRNRALEDANEHLEVRVAERTQSLEKALNDLRRMQDEMVQSEKLASLGRIVAAVAHEMNTPIGNALTVATSVAEESAQLKDELARPAPRRSALDRMVNRVMDGTDLFILNIQRAGQLIADFKQVAVDQTSDQRRPFDLGEVTHEILRTLTPIVRRSGNDLVTHIETGIDCDSFPGTYGQVLTNLVMNALLHGYTDDRRGPIHVTIMSGPDDSVCLKVKDEGWGMGDDVKRQIFDPFFTTKLGQGGSGLGMNIVYRIVTNILGGTITVESTLGKGTDITVTVPRTAPRPST